ncbi:MAG: hypothetical protein JW929_15375 [Anaerolineales bacterium]|nr:hypothetical protein [Anaerolineales bacterium]
MPKRNWILIAAVTGLAAFICMVAGMFLVVGVNASGRDWGAADARRQAVENALEAMLPDEVQAADSADLARAMERLKQEEFIVRVWMVDLEGDVRLSLNGPAGPESNVYDLSQYEEDLIFAVEPGQLDPLTELELRLAMALRRESEFNDVYGHVVRSIPGPDGTAAVLVGVTYEAVDPTPKTFDLALALVGTVGFFLFWLGLPFWTFLDARSRGDGRAAVLWGLFVLVANAAGLLAYLLVKRRSP